MFALSHLPLRGQRAAAMIFFVGGILALLAVLAFGIKINNARRLTLGFGDFLCAAVRVYENADGFGCLVALMPDAICGNDSGNDGGEKPGISNGIPACA